MRLIPFCSFNINCDTGNSIQVRNHLSRILLSQSHPQEKLSKVNSRWHYEMRCDTCLWSILARVRCKETSRTTSRWAWSARFIICCSSCFPLSFLPSSFSSALHSHFDSFWTPVSFSCSTLLSPPPSPRRPQPPTYPFLWCKMPISNSLTLFACITSMASKLVTRCKSSGKENSD